MKFIKIFLIILSRGGFVGQYNAKNAAFEIILNWYDLNPWVCCPACYPLPINLCIMPPRIFRWVCCRPYFSTANLKFN